MIRIGNRSYAHKGLLDQWLLAQVRQYFHPHTIRHTFATRCFENGIEPKVAQKLLGHSSITVTMNIYTHVMEDKMGDEISKFGYALTDTEAKAYKELLGDMKQISVHSNL